MNKDEAEINADGVTRNVHTGDSLPLWHEELEPQDSLLDILSSSSAEPMST
ncbi:putative Proteasome subunit beta type-6 [Cocos nucifera]|uniref:Putative Proteasome subunit beta type-6 n=1 Tax=Cocos nucifera TaxID=13894 RepID=A0A8K0I120_COCNU|nr:putative Proteasome subunit beta type-6 [Cocos nucifera]